MSQPSLPPRPQRNNASATKNDTPLVPPRPVRKTDPSPDREGATRSPFNLPPTSLSNKPQVTKRTSQELPRRPPSVSLPTLGQEGAEYSSFDELPAEAHGVSASEEPGEQTRNVAVDLPMYQPKASVPQATATKNIQKIRDTDSTQAALAGIGRSKPADDVHKLPPGDASPSGVARVTSNIKRAPSAEPPNVLRTKASFNRSTSSLQPLDRTTSRPGSLFGGDDHEHGIPVIGQQVPLLAMAGDVQAPTPSGGSSVHSPGIGFFNDGSVRSHQRKRSSRQEFGPPDSYGIRHDADHADQFEREWVRKHPEEAAKEGYHLHLPKPESALSSEQLNRIVRESDSGAGVSPGTPGEDEAMEEYLSRMSSPNVPLAQRKKRASSGSVPPESPLRKNFSNRLHPSDAAAVEDSPKRASKSYHYESDTDHEHEHYDGTPILAADELMKRPSSAFMHAAVVPEPHADDDYYDSDHARSRRRSMDTSRPSSRPSSVHGNLQGYAGGSLHRFISREEEHHSGVGTPLAEIEEYEPLFPEGEDGKKAQQKKTKARPDLAAMHHFPSQDVWEDTPSSLQYSATVSTPELERQQEALEAEKAAVSTASTFETPEQETARRAANDADMTSDKKTYIKPHFKPGVLEDHRPTAHRFPSSDVWEDTPSSMYATTTVSTPEEEESQARAPAARPSIPARPAKNSRLAQEVPVDEQETSPTKTRAPSIPDKPKPSIPARPQRTSRSEQEGAPLDQSTSAGGDEAIKSPPAPKAKPAVPARPTGSKIAALQSGFMNDLNNRLKLGPQGPPPKKDEVAVEEDSSTEKQPLADARKTRARGPPRRKPAASPAADRKSSLTFAMSPLITCWTIDETDELKVQTENKENKDPNATEVEKAIEENEKVNTDSAAPAEEGDHSAAQAAASEIAKSPDPIEAAGRHSNAAADLQAALAEAGAGPAPSLSLGGPELSNATLPSTAQVDKDEDVQTGETEISTIQSPSSGNEEHVTVLQGAKAVEDGDGDVVEKHAQEAS
ncbi:uncharacterized protein MYCFIDRAFT_89258 [Pseudocercospora fijiensis CIRAD86]|uniref:Altered inheritance of mitochondria protein 21 n=1 Tax=Pseudocercospora fijiensis (strain CIRAD86) TaxID=383855 RepID=M3AIY7_PSEFD|nr:uncharacterized protein MYCFIDRAFT_89258 [Pseudocercospora fijiensis CIRAD86]EME77442.1 hypothetical protein MYCFIDRAFT_89258 [Pseudocercospora fijiensis CIRAD86]